MKPNNAAEQRAEIDRLIAAENWRQAETALRELWQAEHTSSVASFVASRFEKLRPHVALRPYRLAVLRSFTLEPVVPLLRAMAFLAGIDLTVYIGGFDNYAQQILDAGSDFYRFEPDAVILALQTRDVLREVWEEYTSIGPAVAAHSAEQYLVSLRQWLDVFRSRSNAHLLIHNLEKPLQAAEGILDQQDSNGQEAVIGSVNSELKSLSQTMRGVSVVDYEGLVSRAGREKWHDERKWLVMRMPIAAENLLAMAEEWLRFLHPLTGKIGKVLVTDLDNTLWGGVLGEDGIDGIKVSREYPGAAYQALQRAMLDLNRRGILLAIASKNNEDEALRAIETHPEMVLKRSHFAALQIHWNSKAESLRRIAEELNVGLDSLVFVDDNPVERQNVRLELPEVTVIDLPADPMGYARAVRRCAMFERLSLSAEDRQRTNMYAEQEQRRALERSHGSLEEFYRSLEQKVKVERLNQANLARTEQLLHKTNQFNLTTRRHTAVDLERFAANPAWRVYTARVADKFGDNGLVGVLITHTDHGVCEIDSFLLSCRVIARTVEDALLHFLAEEARAGGAKSLQGWFVPTKKNKPAEKFYETRGFQLAETGEAGSRWVMNLCEAKLECPAWIALEVPSGAVEECTHA